MYRALYRKWRPQRFEDVVGQRAIVTALKNQITAGRVGHAYLFTGVRGTGKTTCAKIFAKAVNCLHPEGGDPCGECEICKGIDNGSLLDVVEMDAASNNGVDDIRDLRDETAYTPSACQYKVYIIDEVHMLSTAAFNALLKTLEEPPAHVIFILATTEIQKVPATILSRCQRYDFTRIGPEDIARRVEYIAGEEKLELTSDGAELIARLADGALRDALSILDTCAGVTAKIDADVVRRMAGVTDRSYLFHISDALEAQDAAAALAQLEKGYTPSGDVEAARSLLESLASLRPADYQSSFAAQLEALYQEISSRPGFSYDPGSDAAYQSYALQYARQGRAAMADTLGQTAHLTGGYGSSYAQSAAQQSYQRHLQQLSDMLPQLQSVAYNRYRDAGEALLDRYGLLQGQEEAEYDRWQDQVAAWQKEVAQAQSQYDQISSRDLKNYQLLLDYFADKAAAEQKGMRTSSTGSSAVSSIGNTASLSSTAAESLERAMRNYLKNGDTQQADTLLSQYKGRMTAAQRARFEALFATWNHPANW